MSRTLKRVLLIGGGLALLVLIAWPKLPFSNDEAADEASFTAQRNAPLNVRTHVVDEQSLADKIVTTGTLLPNEEVELRSEISGRIVGLHFQEGRPVQEGALLFELNDDDLQARLAQAQFRLKLAQDRAFRQEQLLEKGGISQEEFESTQNEVNVLESESELIQVEIAKTQIRAPFSGIIGLRAVSVGSYLTPNTPVATLKDLNPIKVEFSIPERYAQRVAVGDEIVFTVEGMDDTFRGTIYAFEPRIDENTRTLRLRARSPNPSGRLLPGGFADIELIFSEIEGAMTVPAMAVIPELGGKKVFIVERGKAASRPVETGIRTEDRVQITEGLTPGDTVIVTGIQSLRPGLPVAISSD